MACVNRPTKRCQNEHCGNTLFQKDYEHMRVDGELKFVDVFRCTNCGKCEIVKKHPRRTNQKRALDLYFILKDAWRQTDDDLSALCAEDNPNRIPNGCLLIHSSLFKHHMSQLISSKERLSTFQVRYHNREAGYALQAAKDFVARTRAEKGL